MKRVVVLGGGESGYGSAILAKVKGFDVFLSDKGKIADKYKAQLEKWGIPYEEGTHTEELILNADEAVKSPGIPDKAPMVKALREAGIPVVSEIEFAGRYTHARKICITGSNGKTTTTSLIYRMLKDGGMKVALGGNIGESFAYTVAVAEDEEGRRTARRLGVEVPETPEWYVLELSSFQLDGVHGFRADVAVLMNITPDHLDRYEYRMQNYVDSKFRVIRNMGPEDTFIYSDDDPVIAGELGKYPMTMHRLPFSVKRNERPGASLCGGTFTATDGTLSVEMETARMRIKGIHNTYDAMAATLAALSAGVEPDSIRRTLESFAGVEHRLEPAGELDGVLYVNDSKATNVDSVWYALESMTRPVVWIAGGTDKGNDYGPLMDFAREKVKALVCMGLDNDKLKKSFSGIVPVIYDTDSLEDAMNAARAAAVPGDTVLLSPACASFDLFRNYEDRGERFKAWVKERTGKQQQ